MSIGEFIKQDESMFTFGMKLKKAREACGLTQKQAAEKAGITRVLWTQYEVDYVTPPITYIKAINGIKLAMSRGSMRNSNEVQRLIAKYHKSRAKLEPIAVAVNTTIDTLIPEGKQ